MASESAKSSMTDLEKLGTLLNDTLHTSRDGNHTTDKFGKVLTLPATWTTGTTT